MEKCLTKLLPTPNKDSMAAKSYSKNTKAEVETSGVSWLGQELAAALKHLIKEKYFLLKLWLTLK